MKKLNQKIQENLNKMMESGMLFRSNISGQRIWEEYLSGFSNEQNPTFRDPESSTYNCNHCKNFIRRYGNIVSVDVNGNIVSVWDDITIPEFKNSCKNISSLLKKSKIENVFFETFDSLKSLPYEKCLKTNKVFKLGVDVNHKTYTPEEVKKFGVVQLNKIYEFDHLHLFLNKEFVKMGPESIETIAAGYRDNKNVFKRAMDEITLDSLVIVKDLIQQGSLLDGDTHLYKLEQMIPLKMMYDKLNNNVKDNWCWVYSYEFTLSKFKNELIGVLCSDISEGEDLNSACKKWNVRVDPVNYMKATAPITKKQIEDAKKFVEDNGYGESFDRRIAMMDDISVGDILHFNSGDGKIKNVSIFDDVKPTKNTSNNYNFDNIEEVTIEQFMKNIMPNCTSIEAYFDNKHINNIVTLTTANNKDSKKIFKWDNNYSWTFNNGLAGKSLIKEAVKNAGGNIEGVLNFRLAWNQSGGDSSDLDAWAVEPNSTAIGYSTPYRLDRGNNRSPMSGQLDVDNTDPSGKLGVENITWNDITKMKDGKYRLFVNQFANRQSRGFEAEIEFNNTIYHYRYNKPVVGNVDVAVVELKNGMFTIEHKLPVTVDNKTTTVYGVDTNKFHKVNMICLSPNHWGEQNVGNKHYMFILDGCKCDKSIRSFHNENLNSEMVKHRKVLEVLGETLKVKPIDGKNVKELSGLGFNATVKDSLIVKVDGNFKRMLKINF